MALTAFHAHGDDPLGFATAGDIVLVDLSKGNVFDRVELLAETGFFINDGDAPVLLQKFSEHANMTYELKKSNLSIPLGTKINTSWVIQSLTVDYSPGWPRVSISAMKLKNTNALALKGTPGTYNALGGYGACDTFSVTGSPSPLSAQFSISFDTLEAMGVGANAGKFLDGGYMMKNWRKNYKLDSYEAFAPPVGSHLTEEVTNTSREGWKIYSKSWFTYVT